MGKKWEGYFPRLQHTGWMPLLSGMFRNFSPMRNDQGRMRSWWKSGGKKKNYNERGLARPAYTYMCVCMCIFFCRGGKGCGKALAMSFFFWQTDILESHSTWNNESFRTKREQLKGETATRYYIAYTRRHVRWRYLTTRNYRAELRRDIVCMCVCECLCVEFRDSRNCKTFTLEFSR